MSDGNSGEVGGNDESVDVLQKYDDKWYEHDGDETNYAVILQDGSKKYYKQLGWVEKRLRDEYENQGVISANTSSSRPNDEEPTEAVTNTEPTDTENPNSVFPKFEPGNTGRNLLLTVVYGVLYPVGIVAMFYGFIRKYRDTEERVMGWGENLLTLWLGFIVAMFIIVGSLGAAGIIPEEAFSDDSSPTNPAASTAPASDNTVHCWLANHETEIEDARQELQDGRKALEAGDGSRALMHLEKAVNRYESLNNSAHEASLRNGTRERLLEGYFHATYQGTAATYSGVYELQVNDDAAAAERMAERQGEYFDTASQRRQALKESLGVSQSTDLTEISADC